MDKNKQVAYNPETGVMECEGVTYPIRPSEDVLRRIIHGGYTYVFDWNALREDVIPGKILITDYSGSHKK